MELQSRVNQIHGQGLGVAVISYDSPEILSAFSRQHGITFPLLSDAGSATIKKYGILNPVPEEALGPNRDDPEIKADVQKYVSGVNPNAGMIGIAFPGTFVLDKKGRVTARFFEDFYVERTTVSSLMLKLGRGTVPVSATKMTTGQLDLITYPSDAAIAPGNHFSLALDITPHSRIHVYAPGASKYRIVTLTIAPQPFIQVLPIRYPTSQIYFFKPLNEHVPAYEKPFTLVQDVVLEGTRQAQAELRGKDKVTINGTLTYQACDDKLCYNPASVPLSWTMTLRPLVFERPVSQPGKP